MNIYRTNAGLGYGQFAYLIRLDKTEKGYNYLCIHRNGLHFDEYTEYVVGGVVKDLENLYVYLVGDKIEDMEIWNQYTFRLLYKVLTLREENNIYNDLRGIGLNVIQTETVEEYIFDKLLNLF